MKNIKCTFCENRYTFNSFRQHIKKHEDHPSDAVIPEFDYDDYGNMEEEDNIQGTFQHLETLIGLFFKI